MTSDDRLREPNPDPASSYVLGMAMRALRPGRQEWTLGLLDGPNMANVGKKAGGGGRDPKSFGVVSSLDALQQSMVQMAKGLGTTLLPFHSYHEGAIVAHVYESAPRTNGFLVNPAAMTRFGIPFKTALTDVDRPYVELHFVNISAIGWTSGVTTPSAAAVVQGLRHYSYIAALFGFVCALDSGKYLPQTS